ncbi:hypothetical protein JOF41_002550 [Saccharothrix coeruleofusca]|nr:hypothetical protein [Saccharothrix coeruleofusca]MBP2336372.1 hypothetical protein [Saccharothrix coeruleofusca]
MTLALTAPAATAEPVTAQYATMLVQAGVAALTHTGGATRWASSG